MGQVIDDIILSEPGNTRPRRLSVVSPQLSWELNGSGSFSCFTPMDTLLAAGYAGDMRGLWLTYVSSAGAWGGVVTGRPTSDGVAEITAEGFLALLRGHILNQGILAMTGSAGGLARRAIRGSGVYGATFLHLGVIDEGGGPVSMDLSGDIGNDLLPAIADAADVEWLIDADRVFTLAQRLGRDRSATVRLVEDIHIVDARISDDIFNDGQGAAFRVQSSLSQSLMAFTASQAAPSALQPPSNPSVPAPAPTQVSPIWERSSTGQRYQTSDSWDSLPEGVPVGGTAPEETWRRVQRRAGQTYVIEQPGVVSTPSTSAPPPAWSGSAPGVGANHPGVPSIRHAPPPTVPLELTLANIDDAFMTFDLGDTVRVELGSIGVTGRFRAMSKALDVASQTLSVSGELLKDW